MVTYPGCGHTPSDWSFPFRPWGNIEIQAKDAGNILMRKQSLYFPSPSYLSLPSFFSTPTPPPPVQPWLLRVKQAAESVSIYLSLNSPSLFLCLPNQHK